MTGISSMEIFKYNIEEAAEVVKTTNETTSKIIGINKASRTTCIKPAGTTSLVLGTSSGIHAWHDHYYWRRMRINKNESIYTYLLINNPELLEDDFFDPKNTAIIKVPQKAPDNSVIRTETALNLLERVKEISNKWIHTGYRKGYNNNNVSCTISVRDNEWDDVKNWMWDNRKMYNGIAVLPHSDHVYKQPPFESCTKEEYEQALDLLKNIDLSKVIEIQDNTTQSSEVACGGGACEII